MNKRVIYYSREVTPQQGVATKRLLYFLMKLQLNKKGRTISGMSMYKTMSCEPGKYKLSFTVNE